MRFSVGDKVLFKKDELILLKSNGLSNLKIIKILFISSMLMGILTVFLYYSLASKLKFYYTDIKNNFSNYIILKIYPEKDVN